MKVLLCSYFKFPDGCAGAVRHEKLAQMLMEMGHEVFVVGIGPDNGMKTETHKGIAYTSLRYGSSATADKIKTRLRFFSNLKRILEAFKPQAILMDDMRPKVTEQLKSYAARHNIMLIHDSVEWYSKEQFKAGAFALPYIQKDIINRFSIDRSCRVIAISRYLMEHFSKKGIPCVNIPIVVSDEDLVRDKELQPIMRFAYAGQAGKKDYLHVILEAMSLLTDEERARFTFHILGCTEEQLLQAGLDPAVWQTVKSSVVPYGRVKRDKVFEVLKTADFTILMRSSEQRYAKAGFPTKAVESLSRSTPMIANLTSDLGQYLKDGVNSLIVKDCTPESLAVTLRRAIALSMSEREQLCRNAFETASEQLHYKRFIPAMHDILQ